MRAFKVRDRYISTSYNSTLEMRSTDFGNNRRAKLASCQFARDPTLINLIGHSD